MDPGPRTSPAITTRFVVARVSQATRAWGSAARKVSTTESEMRSQTLSGWPSATDSMVKRELRLATFFPFRGPREPPGFRAARVGEVAVRVELTLAQSR